MTETIPLAQGLALRKVSQDVFENIEKPWTWHGRGITVPGGLLMSLAAAAAYETVTDGFCIDTLQTHFLAAPQPSGPAMQLKVQRVSASGKFAVRVVLVEQSGKPMVHVTCSFVRAAALTGSSMKHCVGRASKATIEKIELDDLVPGRSRQGPYMKFQRLPLEYIGAESRTTEQHPESCLYTSAAQISPPIQPSSPHLQSLGIIALSDYHILDAAPAIHGLDFGIQPIGSPPRLANAQTDFRLMTSLNHTINFRLHDGFRADDLCYIEVSCPWTMSRRSNVQSRIFDRSGRLVATCVQEAYFVMKENEKKGRL